ncbi:MAG: patatin-like phospholipase family protein [Rhodobacterales bacterium]
MARSFGLVLAGGGARGYAHLGVLRSFEHMGLHPSVIVGVSMGAVVAATYALNPDWYKAMKNLDFPVFRTSPEIETSDQVNSIKKLFELGMAFKDLYFGWGLAPNAEAWGKKTAQALTLGKQLEDVRVPVLVCATDLNTGARVILDHGSAADAIYASSALAGVLPPLRFKEHLLIDGAYADIAPIDVARNAGADVVVVVNATGETQQHEPKNGLEALIQSVEICQTHHALLRYRDADFELAPKFGKVIGTLDFQLKRRAIAAGINCARRLAPDLKKTLYHEP